MLNVAWSELVEQLDALRTVPEGGLDGLLRAHEEYLNRITFRALLSTKAAPIIKIVDDVLESALTLRSQVTRIANLLEADAAFIPVLKTHEKFKGRTKFLYAVISKLVVKGYQPHLELLLLQLNFNGFYGELVNDRGDSSAS